MFCSCMREGEHLLVFMDMEWTRTFCWNALLWQILSNLNEESDQIWKGRRRVKQRHLGIFTSCKKHSTSMLGPRTWWRRLVCILLFSFGKRGKFSRTIVGSQASEKLLEYKNWWGVTKEVMLPYVPPSCSPSNPNQSHLNGVLLKA
jgi:hypothetical protein